jgi:hypothetical protein
MQLQKNNYSEVLYDNEDFTGKLVVEGGHAFLHLTVHRWSKEVFTRVRKAFRRVLADCQSEGHTIVYATSESKKSVKFWKMMAPLEELDVFGSRSQYYIGAWYIEDVLNGS